jgi:hypothetical protein
VLICVLLLCIDDAAAPPGRVLSNKETLVATFRAHLARYLEPIDNYTRREVTNPNQLYSEELAEQVHGEYSKIYVRHSNGFEEVSVCTPTEQFQVVKLPYETAWRLSFRGPLEERRFRHHLHRFISKGEYSELDLEGFLRARPGWMVTKVTAERAGNVPVYRFHFKLESQDTANNKRTHHGYLDVDPARSWVLVRASVTSSVSPEAHREFEFDYSGSIHGLPALRRFVLWYVYRTPDGQVHRNPTRGSEILEFMEQPTVDHSEFTLGHYGLGPPYRVYFAAAATLLVAATAINVLLAWRRQRRRRGLTWAVASE